MEDPRPPRRAVPLRWSSGSPGWLIHPISRGAHMIESPITTAESAVAAERLEQTLFEVKKVIVGQDRVVERLLVCLLARGHALLEGVPGLAKTLAAETIARVVGGSFTRIQFTP